LREERGIRLFEKRVLRTIFGPKRDKGLGGETGGKDTTGET